MNLLKIGKGITIFIAFYIAGIILNYVVPVIINAVSAFYTNDNISGLIYVLLFIVWTIGILIIPNLYIFEGIQEPSGLHPVMDVVLAVCVFLLGLIFTIKAWFFIEGLASIATNEFIIVLFWIGTGVMWFEIILGIPAYLIIRAMQ